MNVAVYVAGVAGVRIVWLCAPPSDQEENWKPPCGEGALARMDEFTSTVRVKGLVPENVPTERLKPVGTV